MGVHCAYSYVLLLKYLLLLSSYLPIFGDILCGSDSGSSLPSYEASHEFDKRGRRHQPPVGPPVQGPRVDSAPRPLPAPTNPSLHFKTRTQPPREAFRQGPPQPNGHSFQPPPFLPQPFGPQGFAQPPMMPMPPIPQQLPPLSLRPGQPPPMIWPGHSLPIHMPMSAPMPMPMHMDRPSHLPPRPEMPMGRDVSGFNRGRRDGNNINGGGGGDLNYG